LTNLPPIARGVDNLPSFNIFQAELLIKGGSGYGKTGLSALGFIFRCAFHQMCLLAML